jgi:hypothetical protein
MLDYGADGISVPLNKCKKVFVAFPPTEKNLSCFGQAQGQKAILGRTGSSLEGGFIALLDLEDCIYLPAGCIHATFTIEGGFLVTKDFTTMDSTAAFARCIASGAHKFIEERHVPDWLGWYLKCLNVALNNRTATEVIRAWIETQTILEQWMARDEGWRTEADQVWTKFLSSGRLMLETCLCGRHSGGKGFSAHFQEEHLGFTRNKTKKRKALQK